jgi:hypothetical protein
VIENTEIARLRRVGLAEPEQLDPDDRIRFDRLMSTYFRFQDNLWEQRRNGTLDENQWEGYREVLRRLVTEPGARSCWAEHRESYSASFRTLLSSEFGL